MIPFRTVSGRNDAAFVFADHASNHVPDWVGDLGVTEADMARHIAWDIGSEAVARGLCERLDCAGLVCGFSRLVIDANRDPDAPGVIPEESDGTDIPGNRGLSVVERAERTERLYDAYHAALGDALDARPDCLALSVHSFTPQLTGQPPRRTDIGLLVKDDSETAVAFITAMREIAPDLLVDVNEPYSAHDLNHTVDHNVVPRGLRHLAIELRQDHIATDAMAVTMADTLARAIRPLL
ncbi:MAG: N-formylglutamate amidohydrolase [Pseudomonadota bacterium]